MTAGPPDALVLVHAFPLDARMWEPQLAALGGSVPLLAPHLPGFGGTEPAGDVLTMRAAAERLLAELDRVGAERAVVCGLSMGGYVAFELWRMARERVGGLVLANTRAVPDTEEGAAARRALADRLRSEGIAFLVADPPPLLSGRAPEELWARVRRLIADQDPDAVAAAALGMAERPDSTPDLPGIDVPTLVITSNRDALIPPELSAPMATAIPAASLEVLDDAGHLSNLEAPEAFTRALVEHLERCGLLPAG
ncbi:MAG TPA: alpha/beta fold hydrolase [Actinomycetota bacterium]|nr:alpha/beta fold hydrolase [Actinomycetota bacterium]